MSIPHENFVCLVKIARLAVDQRESSSLASCEPNLLSTDDSVVKPLCLQEYI